LRGQLRSLRGQVEGLASARAHPAIDRLRADGAEVLRAAGVRPDPWQEAVLRSDAPRTLLLCSRQAGKSTVAAGLALLEALTRPPALVLLLSPSQRQSAELLLKVREIYDALGRPVPASRPRDNVLRIDLANGSRILSLPGEEATVRCYSGVRLLVVDEASRVSEGLYYAVRPMLAVSGGRLLALSTPNGRRGWYWSEWTSARPWSRVKVTASQCPRIDPAFLAEERAALGPRFFAQEYNCEFMEAIGAVFCGSDIDALTARAVPARHFPGAAKP
jgi:hypothetical protein